MRVLHYLSSAPWYSLLLLPGMSSELKACDKRNSSRRRSSGESADWQRFMCLAVHHLHWEVYATFHFRTTSTRRKLELIFFSSDLASSSAPPYPHRWNRCSNQSQVKGNLLSKWDDGRCVFSTAVWLGVDDQNRSRYPGQLQGEPSGIPGLSPLGILYRVSFIIVGASILP